MANYLQLNGGYIDLPNKILTEYRIVIEMNIKNTGTQLFAGPDSSIASFLSFADTNKINIRTIAGTVVPFQFTIPIVNVRAILDIDVKTDGSSIEVTTLDGAGDVVDNETISSAVNATTLNFNTLFKRGDSGVGTLADFYGLHVYDETDTLIHSYSFVGSGTLLEDLKGDYDGTIVGTHTWATTSVEPFDPEAVPSVPIIFINGSAALTGTITINVDDALPTLTATTNDGSTVVVSGDTPNAAVEGSYTILYNASNATGAANQVSRNIVVSAVAFAPPSQPNLTFPLLRKVQLPNGAQGQNPNGGWTCTGLDWIPPNAQYPNGAWLIGNDGRVNIASSTFSSSLVVVDKSFTTILDEWNMAGAGFTNNKSIQGVAVADDGTYWAASSNANKVMNIDPSDGSLISEFSYTGANGIAYDSVRDGLWIRNASAATTQFYDFATSALIGGNEFAVESTIDCMGMTAQGYLYGSYGDNGTLGRVKFYNTTTQAEFANTLGLVDCEAVEGVYYDEISKIIYIVNDGAFHPEGVLDLALANAYDASALVLTDLPTVGITANAGANQLGLVGGVLATLNGSGSTSGVAFLWEQVEGPTVTLSSNAASQPTFTPQALLTAQIYAFKLTVTGGGETSNPDYVYLVVDAAVSVDAPTITIDALPSLTAGDTGTATATTTDTTSIAWSSTGGLTVNASSGAYTATSAGAFTLNATATGDGGSTNATEISGTISAIPDTTKPVIVLSPPTLIYNLTVGDTFTLPTATLTDNVDSTISINPISNNVNTSVATEGTPYSVVYSGYEDAAGNVADSVTITVNVASELSSPSSYFVTPVDFSKEENQLIWHEIKDPSDVEYFPIELSAWLKGDEAISAIFEPKEESGLIIDSIGISGTIAWAFISGGVEGAYYINTTVSSNSGRTRQRKIKLKVKDI